MPFWGVPCATGRGMNTSVVFGFVKFLRDIQKRERPDLLGVAFDPPGGSFRREIFPEYKANRTETPERYSAVGSLRETGAGGDVHPDPRSRGL